MDTKYCASENVKKTLLAAIPSLQEYYLNRYVYTFTHLHRPDNEQATESILRFRENLDTRLLRFIDTYKLPPKTDENFDLEKDFRQKFTNHVEWFVRADTRREMAARAYRDVPLGWIEEKEMDAILYKQSLRQERESMEDKTIREMQQERMEGLNKEFMRYLNTTEKIVFKGMLDQLSHKEMIGAVGPIKSGELLTIDKVRHLINLVQFRFICWYSANHFTDEKLAIRLLNKFPNFCSRFFGKRKLEVEEDEVGIGAMLGIAKRKYDPLPQFAHNKPKHSFEEIKDRVIQVVREPKDNKGYNGDWAFNSKWYKGKKYDSPVLYVNLSGWAYSHVDKSKWDIFAA